MRTGKVKNFDGSRGFGFILPDDGGDAGDVFFHISAVRSGDVIARYATVEFEIGTDPRNGKTRAVRVQAAG